ncbi:MAG TPA: 4a-hydroxytetrahydrobiopterin dehydratase [Burkholderiaceae bacterium]|nr:4a-hydroxytetrahydrobiopterin dehydratase [Burkholderiaceae bacterium]
MRPALNAAELRAAHCVHASAGDKLTDSEVSAQIAAGAPSWQADGDAIERDFKFDDFRLTMAFVNAVAGVADAEDHHPHLAVDYGHCLVRWSTHSAGGITRNDFICAAKVDVLPGVTG